MKRCLCLALFVLAVAALGATASAANEVDMYLPFENDGNHFWDTVIGDESLLALKTKEYADIHELGLTGTGGVKWVHLKGLTPGNTSVHFLYVDVDVPAAPLYTLVYRLTVDDALNVMIWGVEMLEPETSPRGKIKSFFFTYGGYMRPCTYNLRREDSGAILMSLNDGPETAADPSMAEKLENLVAEYNINAWNGFSKSRRGVLDGEDFNLEIVYENGFAVTAHGSNSFPEHYSDFQAAVRELFGEEE